MSFKMGESAVRDYSHAFVDNKGRTSSMSLWADTRTAAHRFTYSARRASIGSKEAARIAG